MGLNNKTNLKTQATTIRYEDKEGLNTAERLGKVLEEIVEDTDSSLTSEKDARIASDDNLLSQIANNATTFRDELQAVSVRLDTAVLALLPASIGSIEVSEIDTMGCESPTGIKGIVAGGNQVCYAVSHQGNNSGLLIMYGAGDCVAMQVLVSNYSGVGNDLFTAHRDDKLSVHYRYMPLNTVGAQNTGTGRYTWSEWKEWLSEEWMNGRVDELRSEVTTLKGEMAELKKMLEQSDANFAVMDIEWLEDAENGVWSKTLPARIEAEMQFRIGVNVNAAHVADSVSDWEVKRLANDPVADSAWNKRHPLTAAADGYVYIKISPDDILDASGTTFVFTANYTRTRNGVTYSQSVEGRLCMEMGGLVFYIDRGPWGIGEKYYCNTLNPGGRHETSDVWRYGCKWRCTATHTSSEQNGPGFAIPFWEFIEGDDRFFVEFAEPYTTVDLSNIEIPLTIRAWYHGEEVTAWIKDEDVVWSRYSETDENVPRTEQDAVWNAQNGNRGKAIVLTEPDFESRGSEGLGRISFTAVVTLRHPITGKAAMASKAYSA